MRQVSESVLKGLMERNSLLVPRLFLKNPDGSYSELKGLANEDFIKSVSYGESIDEPVRAMQIELRAETSANNLHPLMDSYINSGKPALTLNRRCRVLLDVVNPDTSAVLTTFNIFEGYIAELDDANSVSLTLHDELGQAAQIFIEQEREYGSTAGTPLQNVMIQILRDNGLKDLADNFRVIGDPSYMVTPYKQQKEPVLSALQTLIQLIGWDMRLRFDQATNQWRLTIYEPNRSEDQAPVLSLDANNYRSVTRMHRNAVGIRNVIQVVYGKEDKRNTIAVSDQNSIDQYGRKFMELAEASTSVIDTEPEARRMAQAILEDLKNPKIEKSVETWAMPFLELQDLLVFAPNNVHYSSTQSLALVGWEIKLESDAPSQMTLDLRGKPSAGYRQWLALDTRPGLNDPNSTSKPPAPRSITVIPLYQGFQVGIDPVAGATEYRVHVSRDPAFVPSQANVVVRGNSTLYTVGGLEADGIYYVAVTVVDSSGNVSLTSSKASTIPLASYTDYTPPPSPTGLVLSTGLELDAGIYTSFILARWNRNDASDVVGYSFRYRRQSSSTWINTFSSDPQQKISNLVGGVPYVCQVAAVDGSGNTSPYVEGPVIATEDTSILPPPTGLRADFSTRDCHFSWDRISDPLFSHYEVDLYRNGVLTQRIQRVQVERYSYTYTQNVQDGAGQGPVPTLSVYVRAVDQKGRPGPWSTGISTYNAAPSTPQIQSLSSNLSTLTARRFPSVADDYKESEWQVSSSDTFNTVLSQKSTGQEDVTLPIAGNGTNFVRLRDRDLFGQWSGWSNTASTSAVLINAKQMQGDIFEIVPRSNGEYTGDLRSLWDGQTTTGVVLKSAQHITFKFPNENMFDMLRVYVDQATGVYIDRTPGENLSVLTGVTEGFSAKPGWNVYRFTRRVSLKEITAYFNTPGAVRELKFGTVVLGDEIIGQNITATNSMQIRSENGTVILNGEGLTIGAAPAANTTNVSQALTDAKKYTDEEASKVRATAENAKAITDALTSDNMLAPSEKDQLRLQQSEFLSIVNRLAGMKSVITHSDYIYAIDNHLLPAWTSYNNYINEICSNPGSNTPIDGAQLRNTVSAMADAIQRSQDSQSYSSREEAIGVAKAEDAKVLKKAQEALDSLSKMTDDSVITPQEKPALRMRVEEIDRMVATCKRDRDTFPNLNFVVDALIDVNNSIHSILDPVLADPNVDSPIIGWQLRVQLGNFGDWYTYYVMRIGADVRGESKSYTDAEAKKIRDVADNAKAVTDALSSDSVLAPSEKIQLRFQQSEFLAIVNRLIAMKNTILHPDYIGSVDQRVLPNWTTYNNYINDVCADMSTNTPIDGAYLKNLVYALSEAVQLAQDSQSYSVREEAIKVAKDEDVQIRQKAQAALDSLSSMADDSVISPQEKPSLRIRLAEVDRMVDICSRDRALYPTLNYVVDSLTATRGRIHEILDPVLNNWNENSSINIAALRNELSNFGDSYTYYMMQIGTEVKKESTNFTRKQAGKTYKVVARGDRTPLSSPVTGGQESGVYELQDDGSWKLLQRGQRSWNMYAIRPSDGYVYQESFDVWGDPNRNGNLVWWMNNLAADWVMIIYTHDEPFTNLGEDLKAALIRTGASKVALEKLKPHGAYALVSIPFIGANNGLELVKSDAPSADNSFVSTLFTTRGGTIELPGGSQIGTASDLRYEDGKPVQSLQPAQPGADQTGDNPQPKSWLTTGQDNSNLIDNPEFKDGKSTGWVFDGRTKIVYDTGSGSNYIMLLEHSTSNNDVYGDKWISVTGGDRFYVSATILRSWDGDGGVGGDLTLGIQARKLNGEVSWIGIPNVSKSDPKYNALWNTIEGWVTVPQGFTQARFWIVVFNSGASSARGSWRATRIRWSTSKPGADITSDNYSKAQHDFNALGGYAAGNQVRINSEGVSIYPAAAGGVRTQVLNGSGLSTYDLVGINRIHLGDLSGKRWGTGALPQGTFGLWGDGDGLYLERYPRIAFQRSFEHKGFDDMTAYSPAINEIVTIDKSFPRIDMNIPMLPGRKYFLSAMIGRMRLTYDYLTNMSDSSYPIRTVDLSSAPAELSCRLHYVDGNGTTRTEPNMPLGVDLMGYFKQYNAAAGLSDVHLPTRITGIALYYNATRIVMESGRTWTRRFYWLIGSVQLLDVDPNFS